MNFLSQALVEGILGENTLPKKKIVGMFGGGFKPPTSGHLEVVKKALQENPEMDALIVLVGSGTRDSISQEESLAIWNIYKKSLPSKVVVMASPDNKPPIGAIYSYAKKNPDKEIYWFMGEREGNKDDFYDFIKRTRALRRGDYTNIQPKKIITSDSVSGTKARKALLAKDKETFIQFFPDIPEIDEIWDMLTDVVKEYKHKYDKEELRKGIEVEKEHTDDPKIALKIALDHLDEDPQYYTKLATLGLEEQPLQERIAYDAETRMQTRFLMKQFLKTVGTKVEDSTEGALVGKEYELVYGFYPMKKGLGFMPFKVEGSAGPKDIAIEIKYNPELLDKQLYSELSAELRNSVRHELEHLAQYRAEKGVRPGEDGVDQDDLPDVEYLTLDYEIPGHIQGLRTKAKAKKISLQQAIDDLFNSYEYDLDPEEEDFVRETWMNWLETNMPGVSLTKIKEDFDQQDVEDLDSLADRELNPIDVDLSGNHFFDRLNDPRNNPQINYLELEDFFTKLGDNREEFIDFLNKYKSVVATDTETNINIPFMKMANKAIAKTVMRKRNFKTPNEKIELEEKLTIGDKEVNKINKIGNNPEDWTIIYMDGSEEPYLKHLTEVDPNHDQKSSPYGSGYETLEEDLTPQITSLTDYMANEGGLNLKPYPQLEFIEDDKENAANIFGRTAYYMPSEQKVVLYTLDRHPKDVLRSYAHELIHHHQNLEGTLDHSNTTNTNEDDALESIEREAYEEGNILFRNWEDSLKN